MCIKADYSVCKGPSPDPILSQLNPFHNIIPCVLHDSFSYFPIWRTQSNVTTKQSVKATVVA